MARTVETLGEFTARHGAVSVQDTDRPGIWWFATGAYIQESQSRELAPFLGEPAAEELRLLRAKRRYHELCFARVERDFEKGKDVALGRTPPFEFSWSERFYREPLPSGGPAAVLGFLRAQARHHRKVLAELDAEIAKLPEEIARREEAEARRRAEQVEARRVAKARAEIESLTLE